MPGRLTELMGVEPIDLPTALERARQEMLATYGKEEVTLPHSLLSYGIHGTAWYTLTPLDLLTEEEREVYEAQMYAEDQQQAAEFSARQAREKGLIT